MTKTNNSKYLIIGGGIILLLWIFSWMLLMIIIPEPINRGLFGDMFGGINSLFSGLALCGVVYSIILQNQANKFSEYQFRFNNTLTIVNKQVDIFNARIIEFQFQELNGQTLGFSFGILYFKAIPNDSEQLNEFINLNKETINSILLFIYDSNKFVHEIIGGADLNEADNSRLKKLYLRNQSKLSLDFHSLNTESIKRDKNKFEKHPIDIQDIAKSLFNLKISMTKSILKDDYS